MKPHAASMLDIIAMAIAGLFTISLIIFSLVSFVQASESNVTIQTTNGVMVDVTRVNGLGENDTLVSAKIFLAPNKLIGSPSNLTLNMTEVQSWFVEETKDEIPLLTIRCSELPSYETPRIRY
jgi:hypothetical protein